MAKDDKTREAEKADKEKAEQAKREQEASNADDSDSEEEEEDEDEEDEADEKAAKPAAPPAKKSTDADEGDEDEDEDEEEDEEEEGEKKPAAKSPAKKADEDEDEDDDDEDEEEEKKPAPKAAAAKPGARPGARRPAGPARARKAVPAKPAGGGGFAKSMIIFLVVVGGVVGLLAYFSRETGPGGPTKVDWKEGDVVDVDITVVPSDKTDLQCAAADAVGSLHCQFEADNKAWSKGGDSSDASILKPYTTVNRIQLLAAGLWSQKALTGGQVPKDRFSVKCKYKVEKKLKGVKVRWHAKDPFPPQDGEWFAGSVSDCTLSK